MVATWRENMLGYLSADIICSEKRTVSEIVKLEENCELRENVSGVSQLTIQILTNSQL